MLRRASSWPVSGIMANLQEVDMTWVRTATIAAFTLASAAGFVTLAAQDPSEPYKLGMFRLDTRTFPGLVVGDDLVVDLTRAGVNAPETVHELVARWDPAMAGRLARLAAE